MTGGRRVEGNKKSNEEGYDSYSLSSNEGYPVVAAAAAAAKTSQLTNIQEGLQLQFHVNGMSADDCEQLCFESDKFLEISRLKEDAGDIDDAIAMCTTAATRARSAMDAPYNNPQAITFARMKHNACVMRLRSLQRKAVTRRESLMSHGSSASDDQEDSLRNQGRFSSPLSFLPSCARSEATTIVQRHVLLLFLPQMERSRPARAGTVDRAAGTRRDHGGRAAATEATTASVRCRASRPRRRTSATSSSTA